MTCVVTSTADTKFENEKISNSLKNRIQITDTCGIYEPAEKRFSAELGEAECLTDEKKSRFSRRRMGALRLGRGARGIQGDTTL